MNGAESLVRTLLASGVDTCFANPGTSEMHFVAALDRIPGMRCVLGLFEGVVTGAADGYARMAGKPAATLMHCGPGLANGLANLHNARRANSPVVNCVGDQATYHRPLDAPLTADTEGWARGASAWVRTSRRASEVGADAAVAVQAARTSPGQIATLILPSDTCWDEGGEAAAPLPVPAVPAASPDAIETARRLLARGEPTLLLLGGPALSERALADAHRIAAATGARLLAPGSNAHVARGRGRHPIERVPYPLDAAIRTLAGVRHLILVGATAPVQFLRLSREAEPAHPGRCRGACAGAAGTGRGGGAGGAGGRAGGAEGRAAGACAGHAGARRHLARGVRAVARGAAAGTGRGGGREHHLRPRHVRRHALRRTA